jgi:putative FmdB family regulatory protein
MPLYELYCDCGYDMESVRGMNESLPTCPQCNKTLRKAVGSNIMVKMKGEGGYPSRRKQVFNTTFRKHPDLDGKEKNK